MTSPNIYFQGTLKLSRMKQWLFKEKRCEGHIFSSYTTKWCGLPKKI